MDHREKKRVLTLTSQMFIFCSISENILLTFYSTNALNLFNGRLTNAPIVWRCATVIYMLRALVIMICGQIHTTVTLLHFSSRSVVSKTTYV